MSKAKIGVIGAGWWATEFHIPDLKKRDDVELVSVCKLEQDQLDFVKNKFGFNFASTDFKEMLNGRVKTLHPKIHSGILFNRSNKVHKTEMKKQKFL